MRCPTGRSSIRTASCDTSATFKGSPVAMTFIYTECPLPTFCPLMDRHFAAIQNRLKDDPALKAVHLVTVSFDPVTDTPAVLKNARAAPRRRPDALDLPDRRSRRHRPVRVAIRRLGLARAQRPARHHAQPAHGDHRRRRHAGQDLHRQRLDRGSGGRRPQEHWLLTGAAGLTRARSIPPDSDSSVAFSARERRLIARLKTPAAVQRYLNALALQPGAARTRHAASASAASSVTGARTASKPRCSPRSCSSSTATRRWS